MAGGVDLYLQSLRDFGSGIEAGGEGFARARAADDKRVEDQRKVDAEKARKERLAALAIEVDSLNESAKDENFDQVDFADKSKGIIKGSIELEEPGLLRSLDPIQKIIDQREEMARNKVAAGEKVASAADKKREQGADDARKSRAEVRDIRKLYDNDDVTKQTNIVRSAFSKLDKAATSPKSAARDSSVVYNYMKILDPGSVVRESEFKTAAEARSFFTRNVVQDENGNYTTKNGIMLPTALVQAFQKADPDKGGAFLTDDQVAAFVLEGENNYLSQLENQVPVDERTGVELDEIEGDRKKVIPRAAADDIKEIMTKRERKAAEKAAAAKKKDLSIVDKAKESKGTEGTTTIDSEGYAALQAKNQKAFEEAIATANQRRAAEGKPPLSQSEIRTQIGLKLKRENIRVEMPPNGGN